MSETNKGAGRTGNDSGAPQGVNYLLAIGIDNYQKLNRFYTFSASRLSVRSGWIGELQKAR